MKTYSKEEVMDLVRRELVAGNVALDINKQHGYALTESDWTCMAIVSSALDEGFNPGEDQAKLSLLINFVNQEMGNTVEWTGDHWQWKK